VEVIAKKKSLSKLFDFRTRSISKELAISLILLLVLFEGVLLIYVYNRQSLVLLHEIEKKADDYAVNLREVLVVPIWDFDDEQIGKIGSSFAAYDVVAEIHIMDSQGKTLFGAPETKTHQNRIKRSVDIVYKNQIIGKADLFFSLDAYKLGLAQTRNAILLVLTVSLIVIFITTGILLRIFMRKPLDILQKGIDRVAKGDFSYGFAEIHHLELSGIAKRFSEMAARIQGRENLLQAEAAQRKRATKKIRESEAKSRALLNAMPDMMFEVDRNGILLDHKGAREDQYVSPEEFLGKKISEIVPPEAGTLFLKKIEDALSTRRIQIFEYELPIKGKSLNFECRMVSFTEETTMAIVRNITESKQAAKDKSRLEEQLRKAQKMEAIGTLAGGVAHDLNNVLSGLVTYPELILMDLPQDSPLRKSILAIQKSGERATNIVQDLLTLARRGVSVSEVVNVNDIIRDFIKSPEYEKLKQNHPNVQLETDLELNLLSVGGSSVHLSKTLMNLVSNATEAMPEGGIVSISSENRYIDKPIRGYDDIEEGDYVTLRVSDSGIGIPAHDIERIFEPFYTKKAMGRSGTGLGMAVVWGTVKDHKGYIDVQSVEGKGSTFVIYLPASRQELSREEMPLSIEDYMGNGERILVVDDVEEQRDIASRVLQKLGYSVKSVSSGEEAVDYMKNNSADLLVLDMIMDPGIDGLETYKRILQLHPHQKAIIASGFTESKRVKEAQKLGAGAYVKKPYLLEKVAVAIREELYSVHP
jgi:two-component system cell cycle sensor histidine kinase/response regulator CckA